MHDTDHVDDLREDHLQRHVDGQRRVAQRPQLVAVVGLETLVQNLFLADATCACNENKKTLQWTKKHAYRIKQCSRKLDVATTRERGSFEFPCCVFTQNQSCQSLPQVRWFQPMMCSATAKSNFEIHMGQPRRNLLGSRFSLSGGENKAICNRFAVHTDASCSVQLICVPRICLLCFCGKHSTVDFPKRFSEGENVSARKLWAKY